MQEITIITANRVGTLAEICELLGGAGVNIEAISAHGLGDSGVIRVVTGDIATAKKALGGKKGITFKVSDILVVRLSDQPGELGKIARRLSRAGIDIESLYVLSKNRGVTEVAIKAGDAAAAARAIK
jgi:hypothetical protein